MQSKVFGGWKCCTTRTRIHGNPGDIFDIGGQTYRITQVMETYLDIVAEELYHAEGFDNPQGFITFWETAKKTRWNPDTAVFVHFFQAIIPMRDNHGFIQAEIS
jgi:hypothetical protein